jgi:hypothetical protein
LCINVGLVIGQKQKRIVIEQIVDNGPKQFGIAAAERTACYEIDYFAQVAVLFVEFSGPIPLRSYLPRLRLRSFQRERSSPRRLLRGFPHWPHRVCRSVSAPLSENFMLPVPLASFPAVDICSDKSAAG